MHPGSAEAYVKLLEGFRAGLGDQGFVEGRNVAINFRWAEGHYDVFPSIAAEFVAQNIAVIVAMDYAGAAQAALHATATIPVVFGTATDPVTTGLVTSISRPTGNATGVTYFSNTISPKRLELISQVVPTPTPIGYLAYRENPLVPIEANSVIEAGKKLGRVVQILEVSTESEIDEVLVKGRASGIGAIFLGSDPYFTARFGAIAAIGMRRQIPMIGNYAEFPIAGGLMSYGVDKTSSYRDVGRYVGKVLAGARISDLPVLQPTRFSLVINMNTAKALGLTVPNALLATADEVLE
jgi:putative ABC transport system substrate-binding protein